MKIKESQLRKIIRETIMLSEASVKLDREVGYVLKNLGIKTRKIQPDQKQDLNDMILIMLNSKHKPTSKEIGTIYKYLDAAGLWPAGDAGYDATNTLYNMMPRRHQTYQWELKKKPQRAAEKERQREMGKAGRAQQRAYSKEQTRLSRAAPGWRD